MANIRKRNSTSITEFEMYKENFSTTSSRTGSE